jgi:L-rhamnose isomerase
VLPLWSALGPKEAVVIAGDHEMGTNIESIVAVFPQTFRLGGFDLGTRFCAVDDLLASAADPRQLLRITQEVLFTSTLDSSSALVLMLDRCQRASFDRCHEIDPMVSRGIR